MKSLYIALFATISLGYSNTVICSSMSKVSTATTSVSSSSAASSNSNNSAIITTATQATSTQVVQLTQISKPSKQQNLQESKITAEENTDDSGENIITGKRADIAMKAWITRNTELLTQFKLEDLISITYFKNWQTPLHWSDKRKNSPIITIKELKEVIEKKRKEKQKNNKHLHKVHRRKLRQASFQEQPIQHQSQQVMLTPIPQVLSTVPVYIQPIFVCYPQTYVTFPISYVPHYPATPNFSSCSATQSSLSK